MGYTVAHVSKASAGSSGGLSDHIDRTQKFHISKNIDTSRSHKNFELAKVNGRIDEMINRRIKEGYKGEKKIRKDAVTSCRYIVSGSHDDMMKLSDIEIKKWTVDNYNFFAEMYGEENIIRATVHLDETTPHMHIVVVPLTDDGRLSAKEYIGNKKKLKQFQTDYYEKVGKKYGLQRGVEDSNRKHLTTQDYYRYVNANELTAEALIKNENAPELVGKLIELADENTRENITKISHKKNLNHEHRRDKERDTREQREQRTDERGSKEIDRGSKGLERS